MPRQIAERDWKVLRDLEMVALERFCERRLLLFASSLPTPQRVPTSATWRPSSCSRHATASWRSRSTTRAARRRFINSHPSSILAC